MIVKCIKTLDDNSLIDYKNNLIIDKKYKVIRIYNDKINNLTQYLIYNELGFINYYSQNLFTILEQ